MNLSKIAQQLGRRGGKKSVESRFADKSKDEISEMMSKVRKGKFTPGKVLVKMLNDSVLEKNPQKRLQKRLQNRLQNR